MEAGVTLDDATKLLNIFNRLGYKQIYKDYWAYNGRWFELDTEKMLLNRELIVKIVPVHYPDLVIKFRLDIENPDAGVVKDTYAKFLLVKQIIAER